MNGPIRKVAVVCMVLFVALMLNVSVTSMTRQSSLDENSQNRRVMDARFAQDRGAIMVGTTPIAVSKPVKDQYKFQRSYPQGELYAPVTGFYSYVYGASGLESSMSAELAGQDSNQILSGLISAEAGQSQPGATVVTTLNAKAQQAAWDGLAGRPGAVVAINTQTGAIEALVSSPSFDPNTLATHDLAASQATWKQLNADASQPMLNRATRNTYSPGSTFKLIVAAAAMEKGMTPQTMIDATPYKLPQSTSVISENCGGAKITLLHALQVSCNPAFARLGVSLGQDAIRSEAQKFGFGQKFLPEIGSAASTFGPDNLNDAQLAQSSIGQFDVSASPLQMAMVAAAIADDGVVMTPYLVDKVMSPDLQVISQTTPQQASVATSAATAAGLRQMMVAVVSSGTGTKAQIPGLDIGGKTGTAQTTGKQVPYVWFTGYAAQLHVAVCVFVQNSGMSADDTWGSIVAAPIAKSVWEALQ